MAKAKANEPLPYFRWYWRDWRTKSAMALATASAGGRPSVRTVLLKGVEGGGFVFYTNYQSRKARELAERWPDLGYVFTTPIGAFPGRKPGTRARRASCWAI